jgi:Skp family chaperone for outer membrane proteins
MGGILMTDKEFQELVVNQLQILTEGQQALNDKVNKLDANQVRMENELTDKVNKLDDKVDKLDDNQIRMENELTEKVRGLYDFREVQNDVNERIISTLERLEAKIDVLQLETAHLRRVK